MKRLKHLLNEAHEDFIEVKSSDVIYQSVGDDLSHANGSGYRKYQIDEFYEVKDSKNGTHYAFSMHGGNNGNGEWYKYLGHLSDFMLHLQKEYGEAWIIGIECDVTDDVHVVYVGLNISKLKKGNDKNEKRSH